MRAARLLPSWNIGRFVLAAEDGLSKRRLWPVPGGWLSLRWSSGGASGRQDLVRGAGFPQLSAGRRRDDWRSPGRGDNPARDLFHVRTDVGCRIASEQTMTSLTLVLSCLVLAGELEVLVNAPVVITQCPREPVLDPWLG